MMDVVAIARIVPMGMDFCASLKSPERFEPAMIPGGGVGGTFRHKTEQYSHKLWFSQPHQ